MCCTSLTLLLPTWNSLKQTPRRPTITHTDPNICCSQLSQPNTTDAHTCRRLPTANDLYQNQLMNSIIIINKHSKPKISATHWFFCTIIRTNGTNGVGMMIWFGRFFYIIFAKKIHGAERHTRAQCSFLLDFCRESAARSKFTQHTRVRDFAKYKTKTVCAIWRFTNSLLDCLSWPVQVDIWTFAVLPVPHAVNLIS